ncbi:MAG: rhodanese-like domain-containing protein [Solirubrobacteraceae bacterium]
MPRPISRQELEALIDGDKATVVEALSAGAFEQGHLPGAVHLGNDDVKGRAPAVLPDKAATVVTYCAGTTCQNSAEAARELESLGYTDVREYVEGKADWEQAGLPLERAATTSA